MEKNARDIVYRVLCVRLFKELGIKQRLSNVVQSRILTFFVQGKVEGTRSRDKLPMRWIDQFKWTVGQVWLLSARESKPNRKTWKAVVRCITTATTNIETSRSRHSVKEYSNNENHRECIFATPHPSFIPPT